MKQLFRLVQNKRIAKGIFWGVAAMSIKTTLLPPSFDWVRYTILITAMTWG